MAEVMLAGQARAEDVADQLQAMYAQASEYIAEQSRALFDSFQRNYGLSEREAELLLANAPSGIEYEQLLTWVMNNARGNPEYWERLSQLDSASFRTRLQHWNEVQETLDTTMDELARVQDDLTTECYSQIAEDAYYHTAYNICRESGYGISFSAISKNDIQTICSIPFAGRNYSERIWANTAEAAEQVRQQLMVGILTGKSYENMAQVIAEKMGTAAFDARRLVRTEGAFVSNMAEQRAYVEAGIEKWRYIATLDSRTCEDCGQFDGNEYETNDMEHMPPRHPNCRCTTGAALDAETLAGLERRAKDLNTGETIMVPANTTYREWFEKYMEPTLPPEQQTSQWQGRVYGQDLLGTWQRRPNEFEFAIQDVINAQGFDGLPRVVSPEEFDEAVKAANGGNGFVAQRTYSAPDQEILDAYRDQLYHGEWYVDCSTGGAQYGQGMYCAADYNGQLTQGIRDEMAHYQELGGSRFGRELSDEERMQRALSEAERRGVSLTNDVREYIHAQYSGDFGALARAERNLQGLWHNDESVLSILNSIEVPLSGEAPSYVETLTLAPDARIATWEEIDRMMSYDREHNYEWFQTIGHDEGVYAAMMGYDAINAEGHGASGSYTVILNRTAVIFRGE